MIAVGIANAIGFKSMSGGAKKVFSDDVARQLLGKDWRMPTRAECQELVDNCDWTWTNIDGVNGYEVKSKTNRNSIFLGLFGRFDGSERRFINENGNYWANESINTTNNARSIHVNANNKVLTTYGRYLGHNIRPVSETKGIDLGLSVRWAECNIGATIPTEFGNYYQWADSEIKTSYTVINNVYYIDGAYRKYNSEDKLTTLELVNTDPIIQKVPLWHFVKKHFDESSKTINIEDIDLKEEELSVLLDKLWRSEEHRDIKLSRPTKKLIYKNQYLRDKVFDTIEKGWVYNIDMQILTDDVARATLGGDWRIPTVNNLQRIVSYCDWTWKTINGINGYEVKNSNGNSIFLPASGYKTSKHFWDNEKLFYGSSSRYSLTNFYTVYGDIDKFKTQTEVFYLASSLRPVSNTKGVKLVYEDYWSDCNLGATTPTEFGNYYQFGDIEPKSICSKYNYLFYIDDKQVKYNATDNLTTLQLDNTETPIQDIAFWRFIKNNFDETTHTLDTTDFDLEQEEIDEIVNKLWQVTETRTLKVSFATHKLISDEQKAVVESRGWTLVRQDVYQLLDANAENNSVPKVGNSYTSNGVELTRAEGNIITLKGTATGNANTVARSVFTVNAGHRYLAGGYNDKATGMGYSGREYFGIKPKIIFTCPASYINTYVSVVIEQGVTYDDVIGPFVIDITATFANKGQDFIDGLDTADKVAQALGYGSYAEMPYFDFNPAPDVQLALANAVMALDFYDAEPEPECLDDLNF